MSDEQTYPSAGSARGYSWPPFAPGHVLSLRHGAYSPRRVDPLAAELVDMMLSDPDVTYLHAPSFRPALWAWARAESQVQLLSEYLAQRGVGGVGDLADERVLAAYLLLHRAEARADRSRARLGLDPLSRARLGRDIATGQGAQDAALLLTELREQIEAGRAGGVPAGEEASHDQT